MSYTSLLTEVVLFVALSVSGGSYNSLIFVVLATAELVTLLLTLWKTIEVYRDDIGCHFKLSPLLSLVIRDNIIYLVVWVPEHNDIVGCAYGLLGSSHFICLVWECRYLTLSSSRFVRVFGSRITPLLLLKMFKADHSATMDFKYSDVHFVLSVAASGFIAPKLYVNLMKVYLNPERLELEPVSSMKFTRRTTEDSTSTV